MKILLLTAAVVSIIVMAVGITLASDNLRVLLTPTESDSPRRPQDVSVHNEAAESAKPPLMDRLRKLPGRLNISNGTDREIGSNIASISSTDAVERLGGLPVGRGHDLELPPYDRSEWGEWHDLNGDCRNTRADILRQESLAEVKYSDGCTVSVGHWVDPWSGRAFQYASDRDVNHHVPLANAHYSGAHAWPKHMKEAYYNHTKLPVALNAISGVDDHSKRAVGPERWRPALAERHCAHATG